MPQTASIRLDLRAAADFRLKVPTRRVTVVEGTDAVYHVKSDSLTGYSDDVDLSVTGLPSGASAAIGTDPIENDGETDITIETVGVAAGVHYFNIDAETYAPPQDEVWAESTSLSDVQAAITAANSGQTVRIPAGSSTWAARLDTITTKALGIIGAGIDQTIIKRGFTNTNDTGQAVRGLIAFSPTSSLAATNPVFRLSGMTIDCDYRGDGPWLYNAYRQYPCTNIRLDHLKIHHATYSGSPWGYDMFGICIGRYGAMYGVCDNSTLNGDLFASNTSDDDVWTDTAYNFGDANNFYFEDCTITATPVSETLCSDGNHSPRYCFRHNTLDVTDLNRGYDSPMFDIHGNQASPMRAGQGWEIYENSIICAGIAVSFDQRGGKAMCYNNTATKTTGSLSMRVREEHDDASVGPTPYVPNNLITGQPQHISDTYYWGNTIGGVQVDVDDSAEHVTYSGHSCPEENYHFWNQAASFDGSVGIGIGLLAARPTSGLTAGVGYWATDTQTLYRATGATTWETFYTPYTYPHPLRA